MAKQILVVDDDPNTVKYLSVMLSEHGYDPIPAYDGSEALQKLKQIRPDLIVLDVMMPKKSGLVLLKQLKKDEQCQSIPVIMLTGVSRILEEEERRAEEDAFGKASGSLRAALRQTIDAMRQAGPMRPEIFMEKPVDLDSLLTKVQQLIGA